jgi:DNA-binding response OmpR family regulator
VATLRENPLIVIADDQVDLLNLMRHRLTRSGYAVEGATDGAAALALIQNLHPDLAILDWLMPNLQGPQIATRTKADPSTASIPILLLSARTAESDIMQGLLMGADDYLTKPFAFFELERMLQRLLPVAEMREALPA